MIAFGIAAGLGIGALALAAAAVTIVVLGSRIVLRLHARDDHAREVRSGDVYAARVDALEAELAKVRSIAEGTRADNVFRGRR